MKNIKNYILLLFISSMLFVSCSKSYRYKQNLELAQINAKKVEIIDVQKLAALIYAQDSVDVKFIDIRDPHKFAEGRIPNAINIPFKDLYKNLRFFCKHKDTKFLVYCETTSAAVTAVNFLNQLGIKNVVAVGGGYQYIHDNIITSYGIMSTLYNDETPKYNFAEKFKDLTKNSGNSQSAVNNNAPVVVPIQQKKNTGLGGCG